ncbi:MAG: pilus assembly protein [Candidatus Riflebacteria bacterium]|nr:pilus assembly protein [Candidatus Riflebacteria bacterium]
MQQSNENYFSTKYPLNANPGAVVERRKIKPVKHRHGQAVVEMALVLPIFLVVFLGIIDFARAFHCWSTLNHMCVSAARVACKRQLLNIARNAYTSTTHTSPDIVTAEFWKYISPLTPVANITGPDLKGVTYQQTSDTVRISASFQFTAYCPGLTSMLGTSTGSSTAIILTAQAVQRKE